ncbi:MAG: STAS domain-containing protein [Holophagaceae bacterium]|nr:STAS domain-containing protein [Holophagaceae bacterium]
MAITKTLENGKLTLSLEGKLSVSTAPQLQDALSTAFDEAEEVILDFAKLVYVSSAGLRVLLIGHETAQAKGAKMVLSGVSEEIMEVMEMTGFTNVLTIL